MKAQDYRAQISQFVPVNTLSKENFESLIRRSEVIQYPQGEFIFRESSINRNHIYLLEGKVYLQSGTSKGEVIEPGSEKSRHSLAHFKPRNHSAKALSPCTILSVESKSLDMMVAWDQGKDYLVEEIGTNNQLHENDWMSALLQNPAFQEIPPNNLHALFLNLKPVKFMAGDTVFSQGDPGDYFYILSTGEAEVVRFTAKHPDGITLSTLKPGDSFGEEAVISDKPRSATIKATQDTVLMKLSKEHFLTLLNTPLVDWVDFNEAQEKVDNKKAIWLDVRLPSEFQQGSIKGSTNLPLFFLRLKLETLSRNKAYITFCDTGGRSSAAAFILRKYGFNVYVLKDGIGADQSPTDYLDDLAVQAS